MKTANIVTTSDRLMNDPAEQESTSSQGLRKRRLVARIAVIICGLLLTAQIGMKVWQWWTVPNDAPVIGVSYDKAWHARAGISIKNYELCLIRSGARVVELDYDSGDPTELLEGIDALLLTGGGDVAPELSGADVGSVELVDRKRDDFEIALINGAIKRDMPILGICRSIQILNVAYGGTIRSLRDDPVLSKQHGIGLSSFDAHRVTVEADSILSTIVGSREIGVNSFHGQAVARVGEGLIVVATAEDGVIEALEHPGKTFVLTTQWHPEIPPAKMEYFERFFEEAQRYRRRQTDKRNRQE